MINNVCSNNVLIYKILENSRFLLLKFQIINIVLTVQCL